MCFWQLRVLNDDALSLSLSLGLTPHELVLHLEVSVYYLFLQLYALFPCNLFAFFKSYCENSTRTQVNAFQEYIAVSMCSWGYVNADLELHMRSDIRGVASYRLQWV